MGARSLGLSFLLVACGCQFDSSGPPEAVGSEDAAPGTADADPAAPDAPAPMPDAAGIDATPAVTVTFRQDVGGYTGAQDTYIAASQSGTNFSGSLTLEWEIPNKHALIRFDEIFDVDGGPIPAGAEIVSAVIEGQVNNGTTSAGTVREVTVAWDDGVTYGNFGGDIGVGPGEVGDTVDSAPTATGPAAIDVTASLTSWSNAPDQNQGWIISPASGNGADLSSSEAAENERPLLRVEYVEP